MGEIVCLTFVKGLDPAAALLRMGGYADSLRVREAAEIGEVMDSFEGGYPRMAAALDLGAWSLVLEPDGFSGADDSLLRVVSRGTETVSVLRHDYASAAFAYAVDGEIVAGFEPGRPEAPAHLQPLLAEVGLRVPSGEGDDTWTDAVARALLLAQRITGVTVPPDPFEADLLSAQIEPWFVVPASPGDLLYGSDPPAGSLVAAVEAASPDRQRAVAVAEVRRQATALGLADTPGLADVLRAAATGTAGPISADSPLGTHVRTWLTATTRAGDSLNSNRHAMTAAERTHAYALGWFTAALRGVLNPDPQKAALAALRPLTSNIAALTDPAVRAAVIHALTT
ncbi:hypothetical protein AFR_21015 [Actinoplanes friuliensis DSM 7358]|uniref:Uncharacterized protein n=1 Tax=Actinoplanes friuliensis DSM 7358 TaxID=1246995 RepID=U5W3A0_9ACTN|nr:hypothetical protein AFR_21015 [Actinoplanes friuliensis DSM 7358]